MDSFRAVVLATVALVISTVASSKPLFQRSIFYDPTESRDAFAAHEARRYIYHTTTSLSALVPAANTTVLNDWASRTDTAAGEAIVLAAPGSPLALEAAHLLDPTSAEQLQTAMESMSSTREGHHSLHSFHVLSSPGQSVVSSPSRSMAILMGPDSLSRLYSVYTLAEQLGVHFELHGDILPDPTAMGGLPLSWCAKAPLPVKETGIMAPIFDYRGLQPFHDFPEGPDWWNTDTYKSVITQTSKMKMNFIGLHTYPYAGGNPSTGHDEPTVWVGTKDELAADGSVLKSYPTSYANTMRNEWGYAPLSTSNYSWGTSSLFETDCWASHPMTPDSCPMPKTMAASNALFERTSTMLESAFFHGKAVGVQSCVGTETPLSRPAPAIPNWCSPGKELGCFQDAGKRVLPHTVTINNAANSHAWCADQCALANYTVAAVEYGVACFCGNAAPTGAKLPRSKCSAKKCVGNASEDCGGSYIMLAYDFSCQGPRPTVPTTQDYYEGMFTRLMKKVPSLDWYWIWTPEGWEWGHMDAKNPTFTAAVNDLASAMAAKKKLGFNVKMATNGWVVGPLPDRSIFDKVLPTTWDAITSIDLNTGHAPVDPSYKNVTRHPKWAIPWMEDDPDLTAPQLWVNRTLQHMEDANKYGCSGLLGIHWRTRATGPQISAMAKKSWNPTLVSQTFWVDWANAHFGTTSAASQRIASVFVGVDSFLMPLVVGWSGGPGKMSPKCVKMSSFDFVDTLSALRFSVTGARNLARFDYWMASFEFMRAVATTECAWVGSNAAMKTVAAGKTAAEQNHLAQTVGLPARIALVSNATSMISHLQSTLSTVGELGTYMNIESHSLLGVFATDLPKYLGRPLPADAMPPRTFTGSPRLIIPTVRSTGERNEPFKWRALLLAPPKACSGVTLFTRPLGASAPFNSTAMTNIGRSVFELQLEAGKTLPAVDFEWYAKADGCGAVFPAGAPDVHQSVVWLD